MLSKHSILGLTKTDGLLTRAFPDFEMREEQQKMIENVIDAYNDNQIALIEAGTGTGKSLAYLLPALTSAYLNQERTVISTHTINLQEQLVSKDIPSLIRTLDYPLQVALVKGMGNYICLRKLSEKLFEFTFFGGEEREEIEAIDRYCKHAEEGSKSDLPFFVSSRTWEFVKAESETCTLNQCPYYESCYFVKARRKAQEANILVVNHHLLFCDLFKRLEENNYSDQALLPPYKRIIFDEAHHLEETATEHFADRVQRFDLMKLIGKLTTEKQGPERGRMLILADKLETYRQKNSLKGIEEILNRLKIDLNALKIKLNEAIHELFDRLTHYIQTNRLVSQEETSLKESKLRLIKEHQKEPYWKSEIVPSLEKAASFLKEYIFSTQNLEQAIKALEDDKLNDQTRSTRLEIQSLLGYFEKTLTLLNDFTNDWNDSKQVRWLEIATHHSLINIEMVKAKLDISEALIEGLFSKFATIILCSATLSTHRSFGFIRKSLGLTKEQLPYRKISENIYDSPFDYKNQVMVAIPTDMPFPNHDSFEEKAFQNILEAIHACKGQAFVLFTSYGMLKRCAAALQKPLKEANFPLFAQGQSSRKSLLAAFKNTPRSVLLGTDSFWEGVDVAGEALRCVVIVKLPFPVPHEPIHEARTEKITEEGGSAFFDYSVPKAIVKFKQGFGRLVRQKWDRGAIVCLDTRLINKNYGKLFLSSLPVCEVESLNSTLLWKKIKDFYQKTYYLSKKTQSL